MRKFVFDDLSRKSNFNFIIPSCKWGLRWLRPTRLWCAAVVGFQNQIASPLTSDARSPEPLRLCSPTWTRVDLRQPDFVCYVAVDLRFFWHFQSWQKICWTVPTVQLQNNGLTDNSQISHLHTRCIAFCMIHLSPPSKAFLVFPVISSMSFYLDFVSLITPRFTSSVSVLLHPKYRLGLICVFVSSVLFILSSHLISSSLVLFFSVSEPLAGLQWAPEGGREKEGQNKVKSKYGDWEHTRLMRGRGKGTSDHEKEWMEGGSDEKRKGQRDGERK